MDEALVHRLLVAQLPALAELPLRIVEPWGTDNAIWRLGEELVVRLPRIGWAASQPDKEARWLPQLAPELMVAIPVPVAIGEPSEEYPFRWAVHRWLPGHPAGPGRIGDQRAFAADLARTVIELRSVPTRGAPPAHNRARPLAAGRCPAWSTGARRAPATPPWTRRWRGRRCSTRDQRRLS